MATKGQRIQELEMQVIDTEVERDAFAEMAGDYFVGLLTAVDMLKEQKSLLEFDNFLLAIANEVIGQQSEKIESLERAERRRQRELELAEKSASSLQTAMTQDEVANWALRVSTAMAKNLVFTTVPDRYGRTQKSKTDIDEYGNLGSTTTTTKGDATITFDLPLFGKMEVQGKIRHVEVRENPQSNEAYIHNQVGFKIKMNGVQRHVLIVSGGRVRTGYEWEYTNYVLHSRFVQVIIDGSPYYCNDCHEYHGGDTQFDAEVYTNTMPEPYRRRSGGCGGW